MLEINFTLRLPQKQVTDVSLVLKDSDTESEKPQLLDPAFCIRQPENRLFKTFIIYRYIIKRCFKWTSRYYNRQYLVVISSRSVNG